MIPSTVSRLLIVHQTSRQHDIHNVVPSEDTDDQSRQSNGAPDVDLALEIFNKSPRRRRPQDCSIRPCSCSCHRKQQRGGDYWWLHYTPWSGLASTCDNESCTESTRGFTLRLALSQLGVSRAVMLQFQVCAGTRTSSLRPALSIERILPYSAPGFINYGDLHELPEEQYISLKSELESLSRSDSTFRRHVNPAGLNYLEVGFHQKRS